MAPEPAQPVARVPTPASAGRRGAGGLLRSWRQRRGLSQLDLAGEAGVSARHISFLETGRAAPSRGMLLRLAERLDVPLRERNALLLAAGLAPLFVERPLDDPALAAARAVVEQVLRGHEPYPALAVDRHWTLVTANRAVAPLLAGVAARLLQAPVNVLRLSLHPEGLAPRIVNHGQWRAHVLHRLRRQLDASGDPALARLLSELSGYAAVAPDGAGHDTAVGGGHFDVAVPLSLRREGEVLSFLSTTTVFGTAVDVTLSELCIEAFFPADPGTAEAMRALLST